MSDSVQLPNEQFDFNSLSLANPQGLQGGAYFSKLKLNGEPFLVQTPKCSTEKKIYCDLMFTNDNEDFVNWTNQLESTIKNLIFEKRNLWFHNDMDHDSIDYHWQNLLRTYKGNKLLLRCFIPKTKSRIGNKTVQIYNEEEENLTFDDIDNTSKMISILEVSGLKFTSQSFQLEFMLRQIMIIKEKPIFNKCLIKISNPPENIVTTKPESDSDAESDISVDETTLQIEAKDQEEPEEENSSNKEVENNPTTEIIAQDISSIEIQTPPIDISENIVCETIDISNNIQNNIEEVPTENEIDNIENLEETEHVEQQIDNTEESLVKNGIINEIEILPPSESSDSVTLKKPNEVYMEIYKEAKKKAQEAKKHAIQAYLEAKRIKSLYLLDEIESSDDELDFETYSN